MKKNLITLGAMLMATLSLTNCMKETPTAPEAAGTPYTLYANYEADTKTVNDGLSTRWAEEDAINVFHTEAGTSWYSESTKFTVTDVETGQFDTELLNGELSAVNDWFALYPYNDYTISPSDEGNGYLTIGGTRNEPQVQTGNDNMTHIAGPNYPMWGIAAGVESSEMPYLRMTHLSSLVEVVVTNATEEDLVVRNVALVATEDITGTYYVDFSTENPVFTLSGDNYVSNVVRLEVAEGEPVAPGASAKFYFAIKPFTAAAGQSLYLSVNGAEKSFDLTNDVTFAPGKLRTMKFNYDGSGAPDTIAEVIEAGEGQAAWTSGIVVAKYNQGFLIEDETGHILVYEKAIPSVNIGDEVYVSGTTSVYAGFLQITAPSVEVVSEDNEVIYPEDVVELDGAALDSMLEASEVQFIKYTGVLTISGSYYNIKVAGAESAVASVSYPLDHFNMADMNGWTVTVEGYLVGIASGKYVNTMATSVVGYEPEPEPDGETFTWDLTIADYSVADEGHVAWYGDYSVMILIQAESSTVANNYIGGSTNNGNECVHTRMYKDQILTIFPVANYMPLKTVFTATSADYASKFVNSEWTNADVVSDGKIVTVTPVDATLPVAVTISAATRFTDVTVHYVYDETFVPADFEEPEPEDPVEPEPDQPGEAVAVTVADFLAAAEDDTLYELTGVIQEVVNTKYGNFYLADETGSVYIYGLVDENGAYIFTDLGLKAGDVITVVGKRGSYYDTIEMIDALYISHEVGEGTEPEPEPEPDQPGDVIVATIADVLAAEVSSEVWYQMTGTITEIVNTTYGNFYLEDETGRIYVYGLTAAPVAKNDKSFSSLGLKDGDIVTIIGTRSDHNGSAEVGGPAYYVSHESGSTEPEPEEPGQGDDVITAEYKLSFADISNRIVFTPQQQVWSQNGVVLTNDKAASTNDVADYYNPARFYKNSSITIEMEDGAAITKIVFTCNQSKYTTALMDSIQDATAEGNVVTVEFDSPVTSYIIEALSGGQVRLNDLTVYAD